MVNLAGIIGELIEERGLDRSVLVGIVCEGILAAYEKKYPNLPLKAEYDHEEGDVRILIKKTVVPTVVDEDLQVSTRKALYINKKLQEGDEVWVPFEKKIGRIEVLQARQVVASRIREVEAKALYETFKGRVGTVVHGTVYKCERNGVVVRVDDALAYLPKSLSVPGDKYVVGAPIRALLKEVLLEPRNDNQLILDRSSEDFIRQLLELEVPEVFERLIEVKKVVRVPGYKSKVAVISHDKNIDAVGTCIGVGGGRIRPVLKEIGGERIDVIAWDDSLQDLVRSALKPAKVEKVSVEDGIAYVWVDEDQRSLAIGKMGQNIALASRLVGVDVRLVQDSVDDDQGSAPLKDANISVQ